MSYGIRRFRSHSFPLALLRHRVVIADGKWECGEQHPFPWARHWRHTCMPEIIKQRLSCARQWWTRCNSKNKTFRLWFKADIWLEEWVLRLNRSFCGAYREAGGGGGSRDNYCNYEKRCERKWNHDDLCGPARLIIRWWNCVSLSARHHQVHPIVPVAAQT